MGGAAAPANPHASGGNRSMIANNMNMTKLEFNKEEFDNLYEGKEVEKVWIDFGKINTNVLRFDPLARDEMNFMGHKMYYMLPPNM